MADGGVEVYGLRETKALMRKFAPELAKQMDSDIKQVLSPIVDRARGMVPPVEPLGRWNDKVFRPGSRPSTSSYSKRWEYERLQWDGDKVKRGITVVTSRQPRRRGDHYTGVYAVINRDAAGAVYELMGSGKSRVPMIGNVRGRHGSAKRLIWKAWDQMGAGRWARQKVVAIIRDYEARVQARLDTAGAR